MSTTKSIYFPVRHKHSNPSDYYRGLIAMNASDSDYYRCTAQQKLPGRVAGEFGSELF
jgi:hypothetical protein